MGLICAIALLEVSFSFQENRRPHDTLHKLQQCHKRHCGDVAFRWWNCPCFKTSNQRGCCWMIMELTFHPCWTYVVLLEEAHCVVEHNHRTYKRSEYMVLPWCGALSLALWSKHLQCVHHPARWNSFGLIFWVSQLQMHIGLRFPHTAPKVKDALYCCYCFYT